MKKHMLIAGFVALSTLAASAEGYQVNTLSARQNGMGHTGTALKLGAESNIFNPAGLGWLDSRIDFSGSVTGIFATAYATPQGSDTRYSTSNTPSTPMSFNLGMKVFDNFSAGISFYTPYGSGINWGENWPGAVLSQSVTLKAFTIQPTVAYRILPNLSVGAGAMVTWGTVNLDKGLVPADSYNMVLSMMNIPATMTDVPASINLKGRAATTVGINVGAMWDILPQLTVGFSYRQQMNLKVKCGTASLTYANSMAQQILGNTLDVIDQANFKAQMPAPAVYNMGLSYRPLKNLTVAFDAQLTGWKCYRTLDIEFLSDMLTPYNQHLTKESRNSWTYHLGAEWNTTKRLDLRLGLMVDTTPVNKEHYNPETPGATKIEPSIGFSFRPIKNFSIDASLLYVAGLNVNDASCTYDDLLLKSQGLPESVYSRTFTADYKVHAWNPSIGVSFRF